MKRNKIKPRVFRCNQ